MKKKDPLKHKFVEILSKNPIIAFAAQKCGISRSTFYRWQEDDENFAAEVSIALSEGVDTINDIAESYVVSGVKSGDKAYIKYWLSNNKKNYMDKHKVDNEADFVPVAQNLKKVFEDETNK